MDDDFKTEEDDKKSFKLNLNIVPLLVVFVIIIVVIVLAVVITKFVSNSKKDKNTQESTQNIVNLNSELDGTYGFAREKEYIVALRKDKENKKVYNLSQGTGNYGEFLDYTYFDKKLYLLFDNNISVISLTDGNGVYELKKEYSYEKVSCKDGTIGKSTNLIVTDNIIYFNNSSCAISGFNYSDDENETNQVNIYQFNSLKNSNMTYDDNTLFFTGDNKLFKVSEEDGEIKEIANNISSDYPLFVCDGVLVYSNKNNDSTYNFFGMNTDSFENGEIVKNANGLKIYDKTYYYFDNKGVYMYDGTTSNSIYNIRYNQLSNLEIYNGILQIVDKSTIMEDKKRITNINLKDNKTSNTIHEYSMIRNIKK